jgi:hypothetical protein
MEPGEIIYPALLICGLITVMMVVGIGSAYLWLRVMSRRLSICPNCQRQNAGHIVESIVVDTTSHMDFKARTPARVTTTTVEDRWQCQHCGHEWTKSVRQTERVAVHPSK